MGNSPGLPLLSINTRTRPTIDPSTPPTLLSSAHPNRATHRTSLTPALVLSQVFQPQSTYCLFFVDHLSKPAVQLYNFAYHTLFSPAVLRIPPRILDDFSSRVFYDPPTPHALYNGLHVLDVLS
jgi:hypothetical protein